MRIRKRDGTLQRFNSDKITKAIFGAFHEVQPDNIPNLSPLTRRVVRKLEINDDKITDIEDVQDIVEKVLMEKHPDIARAYIVYREKHAEMRKARRKPDQDAIADYIHVAKYARFFEDLGRREIFSETVARVREMHILRYPDLTREIAEAFELVLEKKVLPSMRSMQFSGKAIEKNHARLYNCSFTLIDRTRSFQEAFWLLLCGAGVGYSVQWQHVEKLPPLAFIDQKKVFHYKIPDTIEGWGDSLGVLVESYVEGVHVEFNYSGIRAEGSPLKSSGGRAPGHIPLKRCLTRVRKMLENAQGRNLRPIECHDMICHMAEAVLAGGIRRSSLISLFSASDTEMMYAKVPGNFNPNGLNGQRVMANNSAVLDRKTVEKDVFERIIRLAKNYGEPGFLFTNNEDYGVNPCAEVGINPILPSTGETGYGFCNLVEVNVAVCKTEEDYLEAVRAAAIIGTLQAGYTDFPYLGETSEHIARREALLGVSMTGMTDNPEIAFNADLTRKGALLAIETNKHIAKKIGINQAARVTTVKPSGTASILLKGVGSGIHAHWARRYIRRVTANPLEFPAQYFRKINPHMVKTKPNGDWTIEFPIEAPENAIVVKHQSAADFMEKVFQTYKNWIVPGTALPDSSPGLTHNVSATVAFDDGELEGVIETIWDNRHRVAAIAFAPKMIDKKFPFAPMEAIMTPADETRWNELIANYKKVDWSKFEETEDNTKHSMEIACIAGQCVRFIM